MKITLQKDKDFIKAHSKGVLFGGVCSVVGAVVLVAALVAINSRDSSASSKLIPVGMNISTLDKSTVSSALENALQKADITVSDDDEVETVTNADGSVTQVITHADGTTTEVTVNTDGTTKVTNKSADSSGTSGNSSASTSGNASSGSTSNSSGSTSTPSGGTSNNSSTSTPNQSSSTSSESKQTVSFSGSAVVQQVTAHVKGFMMYIPDQLNQYLASNEITQDEYNEWYPTAGAGYYTVNYPVGQYTQEYIVSDLVNRYQSEKNYYGLESFYLEYRGTYTDLGKTRHLFYCYYG